MPGLLPDLIVMAGLDPRLPGSRYLPLMNASFGVTPESASALIRGLHQDRPWERCGTPDRTRTASFRGDDVDFLMDVEPDSVWLDPAIQRKIVNAAAVALECRLKGGHDSRKV